MRRAVPVLVATFIGLVLLLRFQSSPLPTDDNSVVALPTDPDVTSSGSAASTGETADTSPPAGPDPESAVCVERSGSDVVVDGPLDTNEYGDLRLRVHLTDGQIVDVQALQLPDLVGRSLRISNYAAPRLRAETLAAQTAEIDTVSGATYTSDSYRISLQGALDQASLC
jgi:uncharacterized protein with FMN-binding domain